MTGPRRFDVVGTGSMVLDRIFRVGRILGRDEKGQLGEAGAPVGLERVGGVTLNHLGWARILGLRTGIFGKQADDREGRVLREGMERLGIAHDIDLSGSASSFAQIFVDDAGERAIYMSRGATGELTPEEVEQRFAGWIEAAELVSSEVSQLPLATVLRVFEIARAGGARTVLDLDLPLRSAVPWLGSERELWRVLEHAQVIKASRASLEGLAPASDPRASARSLIERLPEGTTLVLTLGKEGALVCAPGGAGDAWVDAVGVDARDTTGAGDAFLGGLLAGLRLGLPPRDAVRLGNACGAACCERIGAFPDHPEACRRRVLEHFAALGGAGLELPAFDVRARVPELEPATHAFLRTATDELARVASELDAEALSRAAQLILGAERRGGRVHVTGVGKPAHVAAYTAALLASTGTPAVFLDATEATHGSAGQVCAGDVVIAISNSGTTHEILSAVSALADMGALVLAVTADPGSPLARASQEVLRARVRNEGGPLGLAPRASVLAETLVLAALSVELQARKGFDRAGYHRRHPGGALGRRSADD